MKITSKVLFCILFFTNLVFANAQKDDNSFITKFEYGKMLYNNPRGIGCVKCHGPKAQGIKIVSFEHTYRNKKYNCTVKTYPIKDIEYERFYKKVNGKEYEKKTFKNNEICEKLIYNADIMPTYFLVEEEIEAIYYYITNLKEK